jgi:hypothetical protein
MIRILLLAWAALFFLVAPARAAEPALSAAQLCRVQAAIRFRTLAWTAEECGRIAAALAVAPSPRTFSALAINESDLRPRAIAWHGPRVADVGLLGIRCVLDNAGHVCTNGAASGYTIEQLRDAATNIAVGAVLWANNGGRLSRWNAGARDYAANVRAIAAALGGARVPVASFRVRKLIAQILAATQRQS